jgi:hypothetical protein
VDWISLYIYTVLTIVLFCVCTVGQFPLPRGTVRGVCLFCISLTQDTTQSFTRSI